MTRAELRSLADASFRRARTPRLGRPMSPAPWSVNGSAQPQQCLQRDGGHRAESTFTANPEVAGLGRMAERADPGEARGAAVLPGVAAAGVEIFLATKPTPRRTTCP